MRLKSPSRRSDFLPELRPIARPGCVVGCTTERTDDTRLENTAAYTAGTCGRTRGRCAVERISRRVHSRMRGKTAAIEACWVTKTAVKPKNVPILGSFWKLRTRLHGERARENLKDLNEGMPFRHPFCFLEGGRGDEPSPERFLPSFS